jgi:mono/diheme cytochrome c family protein
MRRRIIITLIILASPFVIGLALTYEVINIDFTGFMEVQPSIGYREGPRLLPPQGSVPITGVEVPPDGSMPQNPVEPTTDSIERGHVLFDINCAICHGTTAKGDGPMAKYFSESPTASDVADLHEDRIVQEPDGLIYLAITKGFQGMPALAENLTPAGRWDVINYLDTLQASS